MTGEKVLTKHPLGKTNKPVNKHEYEIFKNAIISVLKDRKLTHNELVDHAAKFLKNKFSGNISWYTMTVKLDLEERKIIERTPSKLQKYRLK